MNVAMIVALVIAIPVILFPAALVWHLNAGGIFHTVKEAQAKRAMQKA